MYGRSLSSTYKRQKLISPLEGWRI